MPAETVQTTELYEAALADVVSGAAHNHGTGVEETPPSFSPVPGPRANGGVMRRGHDAPRDCGLAITLPFGREPFLADARNAGKDFVRSWEAASGLSAGRLWPKYARMLEHANLACAEARDLGVAVAAGATLDAWTELVASKRIVTLVAHWTERADGDWIEFADGLVPVDTLTSRLPRGYNGVLDLATCQSTRAVASITRVHRRCTVLANHEETEIDARLVMYRQTLRILATEHTIYVNASARVHLAAAPV